MAGRASVQYPAATVAAAIAAVSLLFLPFAGFTEGVAYTPTIYRDWGLSGFGTYGYEFHPFGYVAGAGAAQVVVLLLGAAAVALALRCRRWWSDPGAADGKAVRAAGTAAAWMAAAVVAVVLLTMFVLLPSVEEQAIGSGSAGWLESWWPGYGGFVSALALAGAAAVLLRRPAGAPASHAPAPPSPAPPPTE
ncbi:MAG: hypothetical protein KQH83_02215 [Actinobacteria bacterium]|nr:hypothetical protein [Actinomycetota bacterium]